ncbi:zinc finger protein 268-like [Limulus polyphemus]|uniref:Zinc finger protein 268-like n=1 Tax=Limulus polyphemus TaxID=6850 RepID=A0ABM1TEV0_LIMPO|nr:zinc finger protein 268-like [Limulus polyphemus]XP_022254402.1 zinc finger protein 268-like [Limulus polyphemus]XP_022254403.1 zinc finger protein 268-like [Limulus polyphemus]XP_022254404.1 zinc finger protein 268-like [Limulus polyphemus]XP_022254405.1 zinc finger protein 268-like [Limulus polyphemus]XP_022254406.1 zinc finger protein 268-like [Limulus polyphemus]XP_022254407.1 zinc finger protein 268-like [Limulus polyphemus]XP_022254408.1 zinc finger protein 268-like [Limulus polyphe
MSFQSMNGLNMYTQMNKSDCQDFSGLCNMPGVCSTSSSDQLNTRILPPYIPPQACPEVMNLGTSGSISMFSCQACGDCFVLNKSLLDHLNRRSVLISFPCDSCNKCLNFYNRCSLICHIHKHHQQGEPVDILKATVTTLNQDILKGCLDYDKFGQGVDPVVLMPPSVSLHPSHINLSKGASGGTFNWCVSQNQMLSTNQTCHNGNLQIVSSPVQLSGRQTVSQIQDVRSNFQQEGAQTYPVPVYSATIQGKNPHCIIVRQLNSTNISSSLPMSQQPVFENILQQAVPLSGAKRFCSDSANLIYTSKAVTVGTNMIDKMSFIPSNTNFGTVLSHSKSTVNVDSIKRSCFECSNIFESDQHLEKHFSPDHCVMHECSRCGLQCSSACSLQAHQRYHNRMGPYICPECGKYFKSPWNKFQKHVVKTCKHFLRRPGHICTLCGSLFLSFEGLSVHLRQHSEMLYKCTACSLNFNAHVGFELHNSNVHNNSKGSYKIIFKCPKCVKLFESSSTLNSHLDQHIQDEGTSNVTQAFGCPWCKNLFKSKAAFMEHARTEHAPHYQKNVWLEMPKSFAKESRVEILSEKHGNADFFCTSCDKHFISREDMVNHEKEKHLLKNLCCSVCAKVSKTKHDLISHGQNHLQNGEIVCLLCNNHKLISTVDLVSHLVEHSQLMKYPIKCFHCDLEVGSSESYVEHLKIEHCINLHPCSQCSSSFPSMVRLNQHEKVYHNIGASKIAPFLCWVCKEYAFSTKNQLEVHIIEKHGIPSNKIDFTQMPKPLSVNLGKSSSSSTVRYGMNHGHAASEYNTPARVANNVDINTENTNHNIPENDETYKSSIKEASKCKEDKEINDTKMARNLLSTSFYEQIQDSNLSENTYYGQEKELQRESSKSHPENKGDGDDCSENNILAISDNRQSLHSCHNVTKISSTEECGLDIKTLGDLSENKLQVDDYDHLIKEGSENLETKKCVNETHSCQQKIEDEEGDNRDSEYSDKLCNTSPLQSAELKQVDKTVVDGVENGNYNCFKCSFLSLKRNVFLEHIKIHKKESHFQCPECGACFVKKFSLQTHLLSVHKVKDINKYLSDHGMSEIGHSIASSYYQSVSNKNECSVCYATFDTELQLKKHIRRHGMAFIRSKRAGSSP